MHDAPFQTSRCGSGDERRLRISRKTNLKNLKYFQKLFATMSNACVFLYLHCV